jgi:metal-dependent amidase/aminoacylase/carboxypeptidase family protein
MLEKIKQLRKELHQNPELSEKEVETAARIKKFVQE